MYIFIIFCTFFSLFIFSQKGHYSTKKQQKSLESNQQHNDSIKQTSLCFNNQEKISLDSSKEKESDKSKNLILEKPIKSTKKENSTSILKKDEKKTRIITIHNKITKDMVTYRKPPAPWPVIPEKFIVSIQNKEIDLNTKKTFELTENNLQICYECEFKKWGILYHRENHAVEFNLSKKETDFDLEFTWESDFRLDIKNASPINFVNLDTLKTKKR